MAQSNEDIKWLYGKLKSKGYDIGTEQEFAATLSNQEDRDWYYQKATDMGLNMGSKDDFESLYAPSTAPASAPQVESAQQAAATTQVTAEQEGKTKSAQVQHTPAQGMVSFTESAHTIDGQAATTVKSSELSTQQRLRNAQRGYEAAKLKYDMLADSRRQREEEKERVEALAMEYAEQQNRNRIGRAAADLQREQGEDWGESNDYSGLVYENRNSSGGKVQAMTPQEAHESSDSTGMGLYYHKDRAGEEREPFAAEGRAMRDPEDIYRVVGAVDRTGASADPITLPELVVEGASKSSIAERAAELRRIYPEKYGDVSETEMRKIASAEFADDRDEVNRRVDDFAESYPITWKGMSDEERETKRAEAEAEVRLERAALTLDSKLEANRRAREARLLEIEKEVRAGMSSEHLRERDSEMDVRHRVELAAKYDDEYRALLQEEYNLSDFKEKYEAAKSDSEGSVLGNFARGVGRGLSEVVRNPLGLVEGARDTAQLMRAKRKLGNGEQLSETEQRAMESHFLRDEERGVSEAKKSAAGKAGEFTAALVEIAAEFGLNPASGTVRRTMTQIAKEFGLKEIRAVLRNTPGLLFRLGVSSTKVSAAKFAGNMARMMGAVGFEGSAASMTTQLAKNINESVGRSLSAPVYDASGRLSGFEGDSGAFEKTFLTSAGTNMAFMFPATLGESALKGLQRYTRYLDQRGVGVPFGNPVDAIVKMKSGELVGVVAADVVGRADDDPTLADVFDAESNKELIIGLLASEFATGAMKYAKSQYGAGKERYNRKMAVVSNEARARMAGRKMMEVLYADNRPETGIGPEEGKVSRHGNNGVLTDEQKAAAMKRIMEADALDERQVSDVLEIMGKMPWSDESRAVVLDYMRARNAWLGSLHEYERWKTERKDIPEDTWVDTDLEEDTGGQKLLGDRSRRIEDKSGEERIDTGAEAKREMVESKADEALGSGYEEGYDAGMAMESGNHEAVDAIALRYRETLDGIEDAFGAESEMRMAELQEDPWRLLSDPALTADQQDAVINYINSQAALDGVQDAADESADRKREAVTKAVDDRTHKDVGVIIPATMKVDDRQVYIVKGNVMMFEDGTGVDVRNSDHSVIVLDPQKGEIEFTSPDQIFKVGEAVDPQTELANALAEVEAQRNMFPDAEPDTTYENIPTDGNYEGENIPEVNIEEYDRGYEEGLEVAKDIDDTLLDKAINRLRDRYNEGTLSDEWRGRLEAYEYEQQNRKSNTVALTEGTEAIPTGNAVSDAEIAPETEVSVENGQQTALQRIPLHPETGEPMFEAVDKETAWDGLVEVVGGNEQGASQIAQKQVEQAGADLEALKKKPPVKKEPKLKGSPMAMAAAMRKADDDYNNSMAEYRQQIAEAEARQKAWSGIMGVYASRDADRRAAEEAQREAGQAQAHAEAVARSEEEARAQAEADWKNRKAKMDKRVRELADRARDVPGVLEILEDLTPKTIDEVAAELLSGGGVLWKDSGASRGTTKETGWKQGEFKKFIGLWRTAEKGGKSLQKLAEDEFQELCDIYGVHYDNQDALNALIDVMQSCGSFGGIRNYIAEKRYEQASKMVEDFDRMVEASNEEWAQNAYGLSYADALAYEEMMQDEAEEFLRNFDENEFNSIFADRYIQLIEEYDRRTETDNGPGNGRGDGEIEGHESTGAESIHGRGDEVLSGEKTDPTRGAAKDGRSGVQSIDGTESGGQAGTVSAGASGIESGVTVPDHTGQKLTDGASPMGIDAQKEPTEAQKIAGNYPKGHLSLDGYKISIENPKGSVRRGPVDKATGKPAWETEMQNDYGYFRGTIGKDKDHIDVYLSDAPEQGDVFVVDQYNPDGSFDEHKVMYGFADGKAALDAYLANYEQGWEQTRRLDVTGVSKDEFKKWIQSSKRKTKPFAEYRNIKALTEEVGQTRTHINDEGVIVDGDGQPMTLYHGTPNDIESVADLETGHKRGKEEGARYNGEGISFTPDRDVAEDYAHDDTGKGKVFEANVHLNNPYYTIGVAHFTPEEAAEFTAKLKAEGHDGIINYPSVAMREAGAVPNEVIVFENKSIIPIESEVLSMKTEGYSIEARKDTRDNSDLYAVKFDERVSKEEFKGQKAIARKHGGYWSNFGKKGFLFKTEADAKAFADEIMGKSEEDVADQAPLSMTDLGDDSNSGFRPHTAPKETPETTEKTENPKKRSRWISDEDAAEFDELRNGLRSHLVGDSPDIVREDTPAYGHKKSPSKNRQDLTTRSGELLAPTSTGSAKLQKVSDNLRGLAEKYSGQTSSHGVLTDFAQAIDAKGVGVSKYAKIELPHGKEAHIRLSNHNANAATYAERGNNADNVSIVIKSRRTPNTFQSHPEVELTEYVYTTEAIRKDGNMLPQVAESLRRMIETGEYVDLTGKAIVNHSPEVGMDIVREDAPSYGKTQPKQMDAEVLRMGTRMTYMMMKGGLRKFSDYAEAMVEEVGDAIRPHLKSLYAAAQNMEEVMNLGWDEEMDDRKTVKAFDVYNFDKPGAKDIIGTAQHIVDERKSQADTEKIIDELKEKRNEQRKQEADKTSADTEAVANQAEAIASKVESELEDAKSEEDAERLNTEIDRQIEEVNKQLALLGEYAKGNEAYNERHAESDAAGLMARLANDLGIDLGEAAKEGQLIRANFGPKHGYVSITLPLKGHEPIKIEISFAKLGKGRVELETFSVRRTVTNSDKSILGGGTDIKMYGHRATYKTLLNGIREQFKAELDALGAKPTVSPRHGEDYVEMAGRVAKQNEKDSQATMGGLFDFDDEAEVSKQITDAVKSDLNTPAKTEVKPKADDKSKSEPQPKKEAEAPIQKQWAEMKKKHPDALVLMRVGDFYETFGGDAADISKILGLTLTHKANMGGTKIELAGFPHHALDSYLPKLVRSGKRVAICEQLEQPKKAKQTTPALKPKEELSGTSIEYQEQSEKERDLVDDIRLAIVDRITNANAKPLTMAEVRKMAEERGLKDITPTDLQELVERAVSLDSRAIAELALSKGKIHPRDGFDRVVNLYEKQPMLTDRDSERVAKQQYSTPVPMGYVMNQFLLADGFNGKRLLEPSAGNGALTIGIPMEMCHVNDIDARRLANLRAMGYPNVTNQDGTLPFAGLFDMVATNPPFGSMTPEQYGLFTIDTLEGQMAINALQSLSDNGRAAIIIGGSIGKWPTPYRSNGSLEKLADRQLFGYLYSHFNVVDIIPIDGKKLYARNGTGYNVRMILIDGRRRDANGEVIREATKENRAYPPVMKDARAEAVTTFDELYKRVQDDISRLQTRMDEPVRPDGGTGAANSRYDREDTPAADSRGSGDGQRPMGAGERGAATGGRLGGMSAESSKPKPGGTGKPGSTAQTDQSRDANTGGGNRPQLDARTDTERGDQSRGDGGRPNTSGRLPMGDKAVGVGQRNERGLVKPKIQLTDEKVASPHISESNHLMSRMPAAQAMEFESALHLLQAKHGNVDEWLVDELGYADKSDLYRALAAEQIEGVAMAIDKMGDGRGFIIADQTGIGKGRQAASIIRYAVRQGKKPIFFTQKPGLFSDMYRDLCDVGSPDLRPFIFGSKSEANITTRDASGKDITVFKRPTDKEVERVFDYIDKNGELPPEYDYAVITYSQIQTGTVDYDLNSIDELTGKPKTNPKAYKKGGPTAADKAGQRRRNIVERLANDNYVILDEAHTAGGQSGTGGFMQSIIADVRGVTYLSATYAKRPDNMPLYAIKTAISESGVATNELIQAVAKGGVPLQEIMSRQLVKSGEMVRRERDFTGVSIDWIETDAGQAEEQRKRFDTVAEIFGDIMRFEQEHVQPYLSSMSMEIAAMGEYAEQKRGKKSMGIDNTPFASKLYNLLQQLLFTVKVDAIADRAIKNLEAGRKPIISFVNTMEGFLKEAQGEDAERAIGMDAMPTFAMSLRKALEGVLHYSRVGEDNSKTHGVIPPEELGETALAAYNEVMDKINAISDDLPIAPLDAIRIKIEEAGYSVRELSGRSIELAKEDGKYYIRNRAETDKKKAAADFNEGKVDVLMVNKTGSTGISLHASEKFADQRQRVMIAAQLQPDVNDEIQMRGRNDRTGQMVRGAYEYLLSSIPAEQRLQMMFKAKLKSLDANTTSSQKSSFNDMDIVDVLNKYGDQIVYDYLMDDVALNYDMGNPLKLDERNNAKSDNAEERARDEASGTAPEGFARKALGRLALLNIAEQERVMEEISDRYVKKIRELDERGENDLEISYKDLKAKTLESSVWIPGSDPDSGNAFADNVNVEKVEVNILAKPMTLDEVKGFARTFIEDDGVSTWEEWVSKKSQEIDTYYDQRMQATEERIRANHQATVDRRRAKLIADGKAQREKGKHNYTDAEIELIVDKRIAEGRADAEQQLAERIDRERTKINFVRNTLKQRLNQFKQLQVLAIPENLTEEGTMNLDPSLGVFVGMKFDKKFTLAGSSAVFAPLDGRRSVTVSLKEGRVAFPKIFHSSAMMRDAIGTFSIERDWNSKISKESREVRYMLTGNILRALVDSEKGERTKGRIMTYTTEDGEVRTGILMPIKFTPADLQSEVPISEMSRAIKGGAEVRSSNGEVTVRPIQRWSPKGEFELLVPRSKQRGGKYYLDDGKLLSMVVGGGFDIPRSGANAVAPITRENLDRVLKHLSETHGIKVMQQSKLEKSQENGNFAEEPQHTYETEDGRQINYTSEAGAEGYGGLFDFDFGGENAGSKAVDSRAGADGVRLEDNPGRTEPGSGLDKASGEFAVVERVFKETGSFNFTSGERIESADDVAFIFSALEDAAKEHTFAVYVKDGKPTVVELGMGSFNASVADIPTASLAYSRIKPDEVYFVHNHPSGNLKCSPQDAQLLRKMQEMCDVPVHGVIINLKTGKYGTFDATGTSGGGSKRVPADETRLTIHTLDKQIFSADYDPMAQPLVRSSADVAAFLNSQRMGDRAKVSFLIISQQGRIVGNIHTPFSDISTSVRDKARYISDKVVQFGGASAILYGDFDMNDAQGRDYRRLKDQLQQVGNTRLLDVVRVEGNHTRSATDDGILYEPGSEYGADKTGDLRFRLGDETKTFDKRIRTAVEYDAGLEKAQGYIDAYESSEEAKTARANELSEKLHTPIRLITTSEEIEALPSNRHKRAKGWAADNGEIAVVVPNNVNVADIENTVVHEIVGHDGLEAMIGPERMDEFVTEVYDHAGAGIKKKIDARADKEYSDDIDRMTRQKGGGVFAKAEATVEANAKKRDGHYQREATKEYMADMAGEIGDKGFERMSQEEQTLWGKIKAKVQQFLDKFLRGLKIAKSIRLTDKDLAYILYKAWKHKRGEDSRSRAHTAPDVFAKAEDIVMRRKTGYGESPLVEVSAREKQMFREENVADRIEALFDEAVAGNLTGKPVKVGRLTSEGKEYLERLSGIKMKDDVSFVLNPSDLVHMYRDHYGVNEKDKGNNIPLTKNDIRAISKVIAEPARVIFGIEPDGLKRKLFYFLAPADEGTYNLLEIYGDRKGNLTAKTFYKTKKAVSQRVLSLMKSEHLTSVTDGASLSDAKLPKFFEYPKSEDEPTYRFRDGDLGLEEAITRMKVEAAQANSDNLQAKRDAMRAIGGNLNHLRRAMARQREYDLTTVKSISDLAKTMLDAGLLDDLSKYETKRILGTINSVVGKQDVRQYVQKVMDIMVDNQLRMGANALGKLLTIKGSRVDARGIEVQGELDPEGVAVAKVIRKSTSLPKTNKDDDGNTLPGCIDWEIEQAMDRMSNTDQAIADEATLQYTGLQIARQFVENVTESKAEEKALRESIRQAKADKAAGQMDDMAYKQYVIATEDAIRQNKIERAEAYHELVEQVGMVLAESVSRAKAWREEQKMRIEEIHHNANSDMQGRPTDEHHKNDVAQKLANNSAVRFLLAPLGTFDQMLRMFGQKNVRGEGYLWNRYMRGWVDAAEREYTGYRDALKRLDEKVSEVYGRKMKWGDLFTIDRKLPKANVRFWDGGEPKDHELTQGNLLYIYMADKMSDGRMKLRRMGITESDIEEIKNFLDPHFLELADWMQEEFLVEKRNEYNEVHKRMFGASMAAIENYFPLKILANARLEEVDVADDTTDTALPSTSTGSIIKRRRNNLALDVTGANAFSVILDHLQQMERWAAFAEFNRDLNTLLSYKRFRNQVMNMSSVYGGGKTLWSNFRKVCSMAAGAYRPTVSEIDRTAINIAKGVTAAKVSFRIFTALKQFASFPAYLVDSNPLDLAKNVATPWKAWKWSMENLPLFEKRWRSRISGDPILMKTEMDWKAWRSRVVQIASRIGMSPNAFVDALTVSIGAHSMYQTKKRKYLRWGMSEADAEKRAKQDATILFNQTQQSSESAFLSTMQADRSYLTALFTIFRNASMSYQRRVQQAIRTLRNVLNKDYAGLSEEFMAKQMRRDGIDPDTADKEVKREYRRGIISAMGSVAVFGYIMQLAWNMFGYLPYLLLGDDDQTKDEFWDDIWSHTMFGWTEGLTGGDAYSAAGNQLAKGEKLSARGVTKEMPVAQDLLTIWDKMGYDKVAGWNDVVNLLAQSALGVNPQSLTDAVVAVIDACGDDANSQRECALLISRVINCPQSQLDKIYFDELGASGDEASRMTPLEIAERYARYKTRRNAPLTGWMYSDEGREKQMEKHRKKSKTLAKERLGRQTNKQASPNIGEWLEEYKVTEARLTALRKLKERDEDAYYDQLAALEQTPEYERYEIIKSYKHDIEEATREWLQAETPAQRDELARAIVGLKKSMVEELRQF